jgi:hypothetical protein
MGFERALFGFGGCLCQFDFGCGAVGAWVGRGPFFALFRVEVSH